MSSILKMGVVGVMVFGGVAAYATPVSSTDAFQGATIGLFSGGSQASSSFDGSLVDPANVTFFSSGNAGDLGFLEFSTTSAVTLAGIRLFAGSDGTDFANRRSMNAFRFFADTDNNGSFETTLVNVAVNTNYGAVQSFTDDDPSQNQLQAAFLFGSPVTASKFRYEVNQGVSNGVFDGVRVQELDAISVAVPEPAYISLLGLGLVGFRLSREKKFS